MLFLYSRNVHCRSFFTTIDIDVLSGIYCVLVAGEACLPEGLGRGRTVQFAWHRYIYRHTPLKISRQNEAVETTTQGIIEIVNVVQDTSASSEKTASLAEELASQAEVFVNWYCFLSYSLPHKKV